MRASLLRVVGFYSKRRRERRKSAVLSGGIGELDARLDAVLQRALRIRVVRVRIDAFASSARSPPNDENGTLLERLKESLRREDVKAPPCLGFTRSLTGG